MEKVLVTGGSGFIALHCIDQLLEKGFMVRTTIRSESRKDEIIKAMDKYPNLDQNLDFHICDLLEDEGWDAAVDGCDYVLHVASPFILEVPSDEDVLIRPAVDGTLRVLNACSKVDVKKVVLTSSVAAVAYGHDSEKTFDESDWSNTGENSGITPYAKSKTLAERVAWEFADTNSIDLVVINPGGVLGPTLTGRVQGESLTFISDIINGKYPLVPDISVLLIDVRDVAKLHVAAITAEGAVGKRFIAASDEPLHFKEVTGILKDAGYKKASTRQAPKFLLKLMSLFDDQVKGLLPMVGERQTVANKETYEILQWEPTPIEQSLIETAESIA